MRFFVFFRALMIMTLGLTTLPQALAGNADPDPDFDRLDGRGKSRRRVDVIEWEGNLEVHVYPGGGLKGLALKLDDRDKDRKVMVIGYRFDTQPGKQLIRRAILSVPFFQGFHVYRDPASGGEYDKIVISNSTLSKPLLAYRTEPEPTQLYPDGHPLNEASKTEVANASETSESASPPERKPASAAQSPILNPDPEAEGTIRPFHW
jgi:hypothetical protein